MPGRKSGSAPNVLKPRPIKQKQKRTQNALVIASNQNPASSKYRPSRLGQIEDDGSKRRREDSDGDQRAKRPRTGDLDDRGSDTDEGSDSEGRTWHVGQVASDDDSEIDSDDAIGEGDEKRFESFTFRGSSSSKSNKKSARHESGTTTKEHPFQDFDLREDISGQHELDGESDDLSDDAVDLARMLDESDEETHEHHEPQQQNHLVSEDEGISGEEEESVLSVSEDENDGGHSAKLDSLQDLLAEISNDGRPSTSTRLNDAQESAIPSDFGLTSKQKLTVSDLLSSVTDSRLRKSLKILSENDKKGRSKSGGVPQKLEVPLSRRQQDQLDRAAAYEKSKETLSRWIDTIKHNRRAEHVSFPLKDPDATTAPGQKRLLPTIQAKPITSLETAIQNILQESGLGPTEPADEEELIDTTGLPSNKLTPEEVRARRAELRRARDLLFQEEARAKRIKKIKSKSYRRVHRKERERHAQREKVAMAAAGVEDSEEELEKNDRRRAMERMGARHRESKWAKGVKDSGRAAWDEDARNGVIEMARREEDLKRRIEGKDVHNEDESFASSESESSDEKDNGSQDERTTSGKLLDRLKHLNYTNDNSNEKSGLASLKFMKNAEAARRAENDSALKEMHRELANGGSSSGEDEADGAGRRSFGPTKDQPSKFHPPIEDRRSEFEEPRNSSSEIDGIVGDAQAERAEIVVGSIDTNNPKKMQITGQVKSGSRLAMLPRTPESQPNGENPWLSGEPKSRNRFVQGSQGDVTVSDVLLTSNMQVVSGPEAPKSALRRTQPREQVRKSVRIAELEAPSDGGEDEEDHDTQGGHNDKPFVLRNQDLVRRAFAGDEVVANFEKEKEDTMRDEDEKVEDLSLPGWGGTWIGAGIGKKAQKRNKGRVLTKVEGIRKDKRKDAKLDRVIINEKRVKKNKIYLASQVPHPYETAQQYERSLRMPMDPACLTVATAQRATKPRVIVKQGIIAPMTKPLI